MPTRNRNGRLEWRFKVAGHEYSHITDLADTERNRIKAQRMEAEARRMVLDGRESELRISLEPFSSAADSFCAWAVGEYREHPNSAKRLSVSMTGAKFFFGKRPLSSITHGDLEDFKSWRRSIHKVREITLRHDLHALSLLFQYGVKHQWCRLNPVEKVEIPSDAEAVRINVLSPAEEMRLFAAIDTLSAEKSSQKRTKLVRSLADLRDLSTLMLNQGCRPEELRALKVSDVDLERLNFAIAGGKSAAAKRTLPLTAESKAVLTKRLKTQNSPFVFPSQKYPHRHIGQAQRMWATIIKRAGLQIVMYDLRHTFATRAIERGVELPKLMAIMGHANLRSIMRYVHMTSQHISEGMRAFESGSLPAVCPLESPQKGENAGIPQDQRNNATPNRIN